LKNPLAAGWLPYWKAEFYEHLTDDTRLIDTTEFVRTHYNVETGNYWVGDKIPPNLYRIFPNTEKFEDRRQGTNEWAEIHIRYMTKYALPRDIG